MPQDTTIFWDGISAPPQEIIDLPPDVQAVVMQKIDARRKELEYRDPTWIYISIAVFIILFSYAAVRSNRKKRQSIT